MSISSITQTSIKQEFLQETNGDSSLSNMLAIENSEGDNIEKKKEKEEFSNTLQSLLNTQKLGAMVGEMKKDISVIVNFSGSSEKNIGEQQVFIRLDLINSYIDQMVYHEGMPINGNNLAMMLSVDSPYKYNQGSNKEKIDIKAPSSSKQLENAQQLERIMSKLKDDITVVLNNGEKSEMAVIRKRVFIHLELLYNFIDLVVNFKYMMNKGDLTFEEGISVMKKTTSETLFRIREDVFKAYMMLESKDRHTMARGGGEMIRIFSSLYIIERKLHSAYGKIHHALIKRNRSKSNKAFSFLPILKNHRRICKD
ncbi:unnamed protein product [Nezara viridula]|uniref:Uncharacterized protein n=1 Tax=Nezara viridula TaxID=85310 RepID=A0A9P0E3N8_NEZVI|nr:unnamed protein product [Nezara viridula]